MSAIDQAYASIPLDQIDESPHNPRRRYDAEQLAELTASIRQVGVVTPVVVRVRDAEAPVPRYELAAGHRRFRAAQAAGLTALPAIVRPMTDEELREILAIDNLQRADVHPLDEAAAFASMLSAGWTVGALAAKLGKSERYVRRRVSLATLPEPWPAAYDASEVTLEALEGIARMPDDLPLQFAKERGKQWRAGPVLKAWRASLDAPPADGTDDDRADDDEYSDDEDLPFMETLEERAFTSEREVEAIAIGDVRDFLRTRAVAADLSRVPWALDDAQLVPKAGACISCPKRTGAEPGLWPEVQEGDLCLDRACLQKKREAHVHRVAAQLQEQTGTAPVLVRANGYGTEGGIRGANKLPPLLPGSWKATPGDGLVPAVMADGAELGRVVYIEPIATGKKARSDEPVKYDYKKEQREREAAAKARVEKATPIVAALLERLEGAGTTDALRVIAVDATNLMAKEADTTSDEGLVRSMVHYVLKVELRRAANQYSSWSPSALKRYAHALGVDLKAITKAAAPAKKKPATTKPKRTLREVRAAKKAAKKSTRV
jgi:ParB/RepB/Spo0J family partition protein